MRQFADKLVAKEVYRLLSKYWEIENKSEIECAIAFLEGYLDISNKDSVLKLLKREAEERLKNEVY